MILFIEYLVGVLEEQYPLLKTVVFMVIGMKNLVGNRYYFK